jgi:hypothetical protein
MSLDELPEILEAYSDYRVKAELEALIEELEGIKITPIRGGRVFNFAIENAIEIIKQKI